ncbi:MAG: hypothetical protein EA001_03085 [Oscillatoriales cyanobacterium]|nr:MAG: hypothetical protein EA001_03085 [Oscillatoriales cyanobacterium]
MVNVGFSWGSLIGIILAVAGAALYFIRSYKPGLARDYDIFFAAVGLLCGGILFFNSWRLDPILQFSQFLLAGSAIFFAYESIRLRNVTTEQAKRSAPLVDDDRPVSRVYRAELDELEPIERQPYNRRIRGSEDSRDPRDDYGSRSRDDYDGPPRRRPPAQRPSRDPRDGFEGPSGGDGSDGLPRRRPPQRPPSNRPEARPDGGDAWVEPGPSRSSRRPTAEPPGRSPDSWDDEAPSDRPRSGRPPERRRPEPPAPTGDRPRRRRPVEATLADEPPATRSSYADERPVRSSGYTDGYTDGHADSRNLDGPNDSYVAYQPIDPEPTEDDWDRYTDRPGERPPLDLGPKDDSTDSRESSDRLEDDLDRPVKFDR